MTKLESLQDIKDIAMRRQETLLGSDVESIRMAEKALRELVDRFSLVCEHLVPHQYEAAKQDFEYFMRVVDLAMAYYLPWR